MSIRRASCPDTPSSAPSRSSTGPASSRPGARPRGRARRRTRRGRPAIRASRRRPRQGTRAARTRSRDRAELDDVAGALSHRELLGVGLELVLDPLPRLDASYELDRDRSRFFAVASYSREPRTSRGSIRRERLVDRASRERGERRKSRSGNDTRKDSERSSLASSPMATEAIRALLLQAFPGREVAVDDRTGGGDHFQVTVVGRVRRPLADRAAQARQRSPRGAARRRHDPRAPHPNEGNRMTISDQIQQ